MLRLSAICLLLAFTVNADDVPVRTDLIDQTLLAVKASLARGVAQCDEKCREKRATDAQSMEFDEEAMSDDGKAIIEKVKQSADIDLSIVNSLLDRAAAIQKTYFESVFQYTERGVEPSKDALFFLDIGEVYNATAELLANQKTLNMYAADLSAVTQVVLHGRGNLTFKLISELLDLTPYHDTFGCAHNISGKHAEVDCAAVMRKTFGESFRNLQRTLTKFFIVESADLDINADMDY